MKIVLIYKSVAQVGRYLSDCPPPPDPEFSERLARLLWTLERIEQRRRRSENSADLRQDDEALRIPAGQTVH